MLFIALSAEKKFIMSRFSDEKDAIRSLSQGDIAAFDYLYQKYHSSIYNNIFRIVQVPDIAQDLLQEVFISLWENRQKIDAASLAGGWLFVVSFNKANSYLRKKVKESLVALTDETIETLVSENVDLHKENQFALQTAIINEAVNKLPNRIKEVFRLCRYEGKSYEEAADIMGISIQSVKDYLKQSIPLIKAHVKNHPGTGEATAVLGMVTAFMHHL
jgi:RNA polymerase sigma factor (sigma-70 family)